MAETTVQPQPVVAFVDAQFQRDRLASTAPGTSRSYAAVSRADVSGIPGESGRVSGVRLDMGRNIIGHYESSYLVTDAGKIYRSGISDDWSQVTDRGEMARVAEVLGGVRSGDEASRRAPEQTANIDAILPTMAHLPPTTSLANTHPMNALSEPSLRGGVSLQRPPEAATASTGRDQQVAIKEPSFLESFAGHSLSLKPKRDFGEVKAGTEVSVDSVGNVWARGHGYLPRYGQAATELLSHVWAQYPGMMPRRGPDPRHLFAAGKSDTPPVPMARVHATLRAYERNTAKGSLTS